MRSVCTPTTARSPRSVGAWGSTASPAHCQSPGKLQHCLTALKLYVMLLDDGVAQSEAIKMMPGKTLMHSCIGHQHTFVPIMLMITRVLYKGSWQLSELSARLYTCFQYALSAMQVGRQFVPVQKPPPRLAVSSSQPNSPAKPRHPQTPNMSGVWIKVR